MENILDKNIDKNIDEINGDKHRQKKTVGFMTLGCKVNQYESEAVSTIFEDSGYSIVDFDQVADVYVINTCTVTNLSDRKSRQAIRKAKKQNADSIIVVMGCYAQTSSGEVAEIDGVNLVIGTKDRNRIIEFISRIEAGECRINAVDNIMTTNIFEDLKLNTYKERTRAYIKIQEGCSQFCSYCIIPYARGPVRSRKPEDILEEVKTLADNGFLEIVLTGIHIASYGRDLKTIDLLGLIKQIHQIEGIKRIRLGSVEPRTISEQFVEAAKQLPKLCPHYHLSLQSGCDETLKAMNRKYTPEDYMKCVNLLKDNIKDVSLTTDLMVGFPGETDENFEQSLNFAQRVGFLKIHVFKYSPRKGTPAALMQNQIPPSVKDERSERMLKLSDSLEKQYMSQYLGKTVEVIFEQQVNGQKDLYEGLTANYMRVVAKCSEDIKGKMLSVNIESLEGTHFLGNII